MKKINVKMILLILFFLFTSCSEKNYITKVETLRNFVSSVRNDDHEIAWAMLSDEVKYFYTSEGAASGRSGEEEFVNECSRIQINREEGKNYSLVSTEDENELIIKNNDTLFYTVKFIKNGGSYKIKDRFSVFRIFDSISERKQRRN